eukprot:996576-Prymnesium_polylepis.5
MLTVFFWADIGITLRTTYFDKDGELVVEWDKIAHNYFKGSLFFDVLATWPWELMAPGASTQILGILKLPRILRYDDSATGSDVILLPPSSARSPTITVIVHFSRALPTGFRA